MSLCTRRPWALLALSVLLVGPATMAGAAARFSSTASHAPSARTAAAAEPAHPSPTTSAPKSEPRRLSTMTHSTRRSSSTTRRRSARRAPPGGVYARNAVVIDPRTDQVLFDKHAHDVVPIASLSKLMTVIVVLEQQPDLERWVTVTREDWLGAGHTHLRIRERVRVGDLLHMSLMCSDNCATRVLARESGLEHDDFIARMNRKALELGLTRTRFVEVTGLDERNVSCAADCAHMLLAAARVPLVHDIMTTREYAFASASKRFVLPNTNRLLYGRYEVCGGKTGFIVPAGYCFATWLRTEDRELVAVVLGAPTAATRFADVVRLVERTAAPSVAQRVP